ncbi:response regulator [Woodsholea maritima]|uniref:response regulator n=1 Tax=Woodsholea maritima TaxID=240237 RepID=UPI00037BAEAD|nr:response regulator [Woodsholea maritima]
MTRRVLAVDDSKTMRDMVSFTLKRGGFEVVEAEDGVDAIARSATGLFDLVITDINMPRMDGITLVGKLRSDPRFRTTPILVLTTEADATKKAAGKAAGATGWIVKPFEPSQLLDVVHKVCR